MRILITLPGFKDHGGVAGYYQSMLPFLQKMDISLFLLEIGRTKASVKIIHPFVDQLRFFLTLRLKRFDLVHLNPSFNFKSFFRDGCFILFARLMRIPVLVFFRAWRMAFEEQAKKRFSWFFNRTFKKADRFIVLGSVFQKKLRSPWHIRVPVHQETTVVNDTLLEGFSIQEKIINLDSNNVKLLFLSSLRKQKGIFELLEAFESHMKNTDSALSLTVAGDGPEAGRIREFIRIRGLEKLVTLTGHVRDDRKKSILATHQIFCLPSWEEGLPNAVLEAMAFGCAVVTTPVGGIPDFFEEGRMGYLVPVRDPAALAARITALAANKDQCAEIAGYNHRYARENFLASRAADRLYEIYRLMKPGKSAPAAAAHGG